MNKYIAIFSMAYVGISILLGLLFYFIDVNSGTQAIVDCLGAAFITSYFFQKNQHRAPSKAECTTLALGGSIAIWVMSAVAFGIVWFLVLSSADRDALHKTILPVFESSLIWLVVGVMIIFSLVQFFAIRWAFGWFVQFSIPKRPNK